MVMEMTVSLVIVALLSGGSAQALQAEECI
jgi:hypothetical protein